MLFVLVLHVNLHMQGQMDLAKFEKWARGNLMRFNKIESKVLYLGWGNPWYQYWLGDDGIESSPVEKDLGIPIDEMLGMSLQSARIWKC